MSEHVADTHQEEPLPAATESVFEQDAVQPTAAAVLRQRDYAPTPYSATKWEFVGDRPSDLEFVSLNLEVLRDESRLNDPMFESFDTAEKFTESGGSFELPGMEKEPEQPGMDPEELERLLQEKFEEGLAQGRLEGTADVEQRITESYEALNTRMTEITAKIEQEVQEHVGGLQTKALEFALEISKKILQTTAEAKPEYIYDLIRKGMGSLGAAEPIKVRVSLDDYEFLDVIGLPSDLSEAELGVRYVADETIAAGCVIETNYGEISLELDSMWEQVKESLFPSE